MILSLRKTPESPINIHFCKLQVSQRAQPLAKNKVYFPRAVFQDIVIMGLSALGMRSSCNSVDLVVLCTFSRPK